MTVALTVCSLASIASGVLLVALVVVRRRRPAPPASVPACGCDMPHCAHGVLPVALGGPDVPAAEAHAQQLVAVAARPALSDLSTRVTRSCVSVYRGHEPDIRLVAVWRWSRSRRRLVAYDRLDPSWSPAWSRELAERAWEAR